MNRTAGRKIKRKFPRTEILKVRISKEHKLLIRKMRIAHESNIVSDADIVEWALDHWNSVLQVDDILN